MSTVHSFLRPLFDPGPQRGEASSPYGSLMRGSSFLAAGVASGGPPSHEVSLGTAILVGQGSVLHRFPAQSAASPALWAMIPPHLLSGVGPGQPNLPSDVRLAQKLINLCMARGYLRAPIVPPGGEGVYARIIESGVWGYATRRAIVNIEQFYFHGRANPRDPGIVSAGGTLFRFLVDLMRQHRIAEEQLAPEMSALAKAMMRPAKGKNAQALIQRVERYLSYILDAFERPSMADTEMLLVGLATIAAETIPSFKPADEQVSAANSTGEGAHTGTRIATIHACSMLTAWLADSKSVACLSKDAAVLHPIANPTQVLATAPRHNRTEMLSRGDAIWLYDAIVDDAWKDGDISHPFTLTQLGSGKQITVSLPGRLTH